MNTVGVGACTGLCEVQTSIGCTQSPDYWHWGETVVETPQELTDRIVIKASTQLDRRRRVGPPSVPAELAFRLILKRINCLIDGIRPSKRYLSIINVTLTIHPTLIRVPCPYTRPPTSLTPLSC